MKPHSTDSFVTFLQTVQVLDWAASTPATETLAHPEAESAARGAGTNPANGSAKREPMRLLSILAQSAPLSIPDLMARSGMDLDSFTYALNIMREAGLINVFGAPGAQQAALTSSGEHVAPLVG